MDCIKCGAPVIRVVEPIPVDYKADASTTLLRCSNSDCSYKLVLESLEEV